MLRTTRKEATNGKFTMTNLENLKLFVPSSLSQPVWDVVLVWESRVQGIPLVFFLTCHPSMCPFSSVVGSVTPAHPIQHSCDFVSE